MLVQGKWIKSNKSNTNGACVEVMLVSEEGAGQILVRDSKRPGAVELSFTNQEWDAFVDGAKQGEFDL